MAGSTELSDAVWRELLRPSSFLAVFSPKSAREATPEEIWQSQYEQGWMDVVQAVHDWTVELGAWCQEYD